MQPVELAVLNNTHWYQAIFEAHGLSSEADAVAWYSLAPPPPFHGNLVVLAKDARQGDVQVRLRRIEARRPPCSGLGLKDSYANLDPAALGLQLGFSASWLWLEPNAPVAVEPDGLAWSRVATPAELADWEAAWAGAPANAMSEPAPRQFPEALLHHPDFAFLAGREQGRVVAGAVVNRSPGAAGVSNFFSRAPTQPSIRPALVRLAREAFPGLPLTGYDRGESLQRALRAGFAAVGELRVPFRPG